MPVVGLSIYILYSNALFIQALLFFMPSIASLNTALYGDGSQSQLLVADLILWYVGLHYFRTVCEQGRIGVDMTSLQEESRKEAFRQPVVEGFDPRVLIVRLRLIIICTPPYYTAACCTLWSFNNYYRELLTGTFYPSDLNDRA